MARLRTFIAVDPGKAVRDRCVALQETLARTGAEVKWVEPDNLHLTLLFLGEVDDRTIPALCRTVSACCGAIDAFSMGVETVGCFPNPRRPRTLWVGVGEGAPQLIALHDALESTLLDLGCYRREARQFTPHLTLGRVQGDGAAAELTKALARRTDWHAGTAAVREVLVLSSQLLPRGPVYTALGRAPLRRPTGRREMQGEEEG